MCVPAGVAFVVAVTLAVPADASSGARRLFGGQGRDETPAWSPNGSRLAFTGKRPVEGIFVVPGRGGSPRLLARDFVEPAWSPDGRRLVFRRGLLTGDIHVVGVEGRGLRNLTRTPRLDERDPARRPH